MKPLGANVGFGYLGDDDDDDASGGSLGPTFDATFSSYDATIGPGANAAVTLAIQATGGAHTNGSVLVTVDGAPVSGVTTTSLAGWTETGWSTAGHGATVWTNTFTKASVSSGTTNPAFTIATGHTTGSISVSTSTTSTPHTDQATGSGATVTVTVDPAVSFEATVSGSATMSQSASQTMTVTAVAGGVAQTNGFVQVWIRPSSLPAPVTLGLDGWSETGWTVASGSGPGNAQVSGSAWFNNFSRTSVAVGTTAPTFTLSSRAVAETIHVHTDSETSFTTVQTDQAVGSGNDFAVVVS